MDTSREGVGACRARAPRLGATATAAATAATTAAAPPPARCAANIDDDPLVASRAAAAKLFLPYDAEPTVDVTDLLGCWARGSWGSQALTRSSRWPRLLAHLHLLARRHLARRLVSAREHAKEAAACASAESTCVAGRTRVQRRTRAVCVSSVLCTRVLVCKAQSSEKRAQAWRQRKSVGKVRSFCRPGPTRTRSRRRFWPPNRETLHVRDAAQCRTDVVVLSSLRTIPFGQQ